MLETVLLLSAFLVVGLLCGLVVRLVRFAKKYERSSATNTAVADKNGTQFFENTKVLKKGIRSVNVGSLKQPKSIIEFGVLFLTAANEEMFFLVSEETFNRIEEEQCATLVIVNGQFFDFGEGEDVVSFPQ